MLLPTTWSSKALMILKDFFWGINVFLAIQKMAVLSLWLCVCGCFHSFACHMSKQKRYSVLLFSMVSYVFDRWKQPEWAPLSLRRFIKHIHGSLWHFGQFPAQKQKWLTCAVRGSYIKSIPINWREEQRRQNCCLTSIMHSPFTMKRSFC